MFDLKWVNLPKIPFLLVPTVIYLCYHFCPSCEFFTICKPEL